MAKLPTSSTAPRGSANIDVVMKRLKTRYGYKGRVYHRDPFQVLIGTIISQRTRDEQTDIAAPALLSRYPTPKALAAAPVDDVERLIRPAGFYRVKARKLREVSAMLLERFGGDVPDDMDLLLELPSVGRKTANCVLVYGFGRPAIPVDTHVHRISNRLGWVRTKDPDGTEMALTRLVPRRHWLVLNDLFVTFGKDICRPIGPKCPKCPLKDICPEGKSRSGAGKGGKAGRRGTGRGKRRR